MFSVTFDKGDTFVSSVDAAFTSNGIEVGVAAVVDEDVVVVVVGDAVLVVVVAGRDAASACLAAH